MTVATPISEYLRKGYDAQRKLLVIRGYRPFEEVEANWMADNCVKGMRSQHPDVEVADMPISGFRILGNVSNDPDADNFNAQDQLPLFLDPLATADAVLLASHETAGFPDANMVRLTERIHQAMHAKVVPEAIQKAFVKPKMLGVLVYGGSGAYNAAMALSMAWARFGCMLPRRGITFYDAFRGDITKATDIGNQLMVLGRGLLGAERG